MCKYIFSLLIQITVLQQAGYSQEKDLRYEILLNDKMLNESGMNAGFIDCMVISPQNLLTLSDGSQLYHLGWGGIASLGNKKVDISGFTYTSDGLLVVVQHDELCFINKEGDWENLFRLPSSGMSVIAGKEVIYVYDRLPKNGKYHVYALAKGGRYEHLMVSPKPVNGLCEQGDSIILAIESGIYSYSPAKKKLTLRMVLEKGTVITSLTADPVREIIYFSTPTAIYAFRDNSLVRLTTEFAGSTVHYFGNGLLIFNAGTKDILNIVNIDSSIEF